MIREEIKQKVLEIISEQVAYEGDSPIPEETTLEDLTMDSLDKVEVLMALEEEYNLNISDEDAEKCITVKDVVDVVDKAIISVLEESAEVPASENDAEDTSK